MQITSKSFVSLTSVYLGKIEDIWRDGSLSKDNKKYTVILTNVVGSKHEAKRQERKFTWDFYE